MRRYLGFILIALTLIGIALINSKPIYDDTMTGLGYKGGKEVIYKIADKEDKTHQIEKRYLNQAAQEIIRRLDIAEVNNPNVSIEGESNVSVILPNKSSIVVTQIREILETDAYFSFRTTNEPDEEFSSSRKLFTGDISMRFFIEDGASKIEFKNYDKEEFTAFSKNVNSNGGTYLWLDFKEGDSYKNLSQQLKSEEELAAMQRRFIGSFTFEDAVEADTCVVQINAEGTYGGFNQDRADTLNKITKAGSNANFAIEYQTMHNVNPLYGGNSYTNTLLWTLIGLALLVGLLIYFYRLPGLITSLGSLIYIYLSMFIFNVMTGEFGPETLIGIVLGVGIIILLGLNLTERIKSELYKGRTLPKAYNEASKKSLSTIIGSLVASTIASLILYFIGTRLVKNFATILVISSILSLCVILPLIRLTMNYVAKSEYFASRLHLFAVKKENVPDVSKDETQRYFGEYAHINFLKRFKQIFLSLAGLLVIGIGSFIVFTLVNGRGINLGNQFTSGTRISLVSQSSEYSNADEIIQDFKVDLDIKINEDNIVITETDLGNNKVKYDITILVNGKISDAKIEDINRYIDDINSLGISTETVLILNYVGPVKQLFSMEIILFGFLAGLAAIAAMFVFYTIFYRFTYAISGIATAVIDVLVPLAIIITFNMRVSLDLIPVLLGVLIFSMYVKTVLFDLIKEQRNNYSDPDTITLENRKDFTNKAVQQLFQRIFIVACGLILMALAAMVATNAVGMTLFIAVLMGMLTIFLTTLFITPVIYIALENRFAERRKVVATKKKIKKAKKTNSNRSKEPEEFTFFGIND